MSEAKQDNVMNILATVFEGVKSLLYFLMELYTILNGGDEEAAAE